MKSFLNLTATDILDSLEEAMNANGVVLSAYASYRFRVYCRSSSEEAQLLSEFQEDFERCNVEAFGKLSKDVAKAIRYLLKARGVHIQKSPGFKIAQGLKDVLLRDKQWPEEDERTERIHKKPEYFVAKKRPHCELVHILFLCGEVNRSRM